MSVIKLSITSGEMKALDSVNQASFPYVIETVHIYKHAYFHWQIEPVAPFLQLSAYTSALPGEPVRYVVKIDIAGLSPQCAVLIQFPYFSAGLTAQMNALSLHVALGLAMRAFIENTIQPVSAESLIYTDVLFLLLTKAIIGEKRGKNIVELCHAFCLDFLRR